MPLYGQRRLRERDRGQPDTASKIPGRDRKFACPRQIRHGKFQRDNAALDDRRINSPPAAGGKPLFLVREQT